MDLDEEPPVLATPAVVEAPVAAASRLALLVAVAEPEAHVEEPAAVVEMAEPVVNEPAVPVDEPVVVVQMAEPVVNAPGVPVEEPMVVVQMAEPVVNAPGVPIEEPVAVGEAPVVVEDALSLALSHGERGPDSEPVVVDASEPEPVPAPAVPAWLAATPEPVEKPAGLDSDAYAEWADLLAEEVELDADATARLEEALAEATGASGAAGPWREIVLDGVSLQPPAVEEAPSAPEVAPARSAEHEVESLTASSTDPDALSDAFRDLLRARPDVAAVAAIELRGLVEAHPEHAGLRRALGDAYMRCGRFQKAIEEYNRAVALQPAAAVA